jgi:hypothetical protein
MDVRLALVQGNVVIVSPDHKAEGPPPVYGNLLLLEGDTIRTRHKSVAEIAFVDGTLIRLEEDSALHLRRLQPKRIGMTLYYGTLLAKVQFEKKEGAQFSVRTPSSITTVTGTEFVVEENGSLAHIGVLDEGHVAVTAPGFKKEVILHFNQETQVKQGRAPRDSHVIERMYHHKITMGDMRARIRTLRKTWKNIPLSRCAQLRKAWIYHNTHPQRVKR